MQIEISGMHCDGCVRRVRKALEKIDGVQIEDVQVGSAVVHGAPEQEAAAVEAVRKAGFEARQS